MEKGRGRPPKEEDDKVLPNGFFPRQWERLKAEAMARGFVDVAPLLREIVDDWFAVLDADRAEALGEGEEENVTPDTTTTTKE